MSLHLPTLTLASAAILALSAMVLLVFGLAARTYRGFWWWTFAQGSLAAAVALAALTDASPLLQPLAVVLSLQWPVAVLAGLRRHYARQEWPAPDWLDLALLAFAYATWFVAWVAGADALARASIFLMASAALSAYAWALVTRLREFPQTLALRGLALLVLVYGAVNLLRAVTAATLPGEASMAWFPTVGALALGMLAVAAVCVPLLLTSERTEANLLSTQRSLRVLADHDMLTGMANRRHFLERCNLMLEAPGSGRNTVLMFDIDHFKQINDRLGHAVGDEALRQIGHSVNDTLREHDVAGRMGGDEFAVLLPDTAVPEAMAVASRIVARLEQRQVAPRVAPLSLSFGIVQTQPEEPIADALRRADQALYEAKRQGRSRAVAASGDADRPVFSESQPMGLAA